LRTKPGFVAVVLALGVATGGVAGQEQGPLEEAGEKMDEAVDAITHPGEGPVEEAARQPGEKVDAMKEDLED
jgi:hypothetical protein